MNDHKSITIKKNSISGDNMKIGIVIMLMFVGAILSGCVGQKAPSIQSPSTSTESQAHFREISEITDDIGSGFSNMQIGWYDPISQQRVNRFTDTQLGMKSKTLTLYYVYDAQTRLSLDAPPIFQIDTRSKQGYTINGYAKGANSKGSHRVWKIVIVYDTPSKEELPIGATWNNGGSLRITQIAVFSDASGNAASFTIYIQEPNNNLGYREGFS